MSCEVGPFTCLLVGDKQSTHSRTGFSTSVLLTVLHMCRLLETSKCKLTPVQFLPTNITALENISSTNITAQGKYFFPTNITALGKYFNVFRLPAPPQQGSGSQPLAPYFNAIDSINWKPTKIQHKLFFFSFHSV